LQSLRHHRRTTGRGNQATTSGEVLKWLYLIFWLMSAVNITQTAVNIAQIGVNIEVIGVNIK
jgi:hypothetical protein